MKRDIICEAIRNQKLLSFMYSGTRREVEPHLLGYDSDGDLTLRAWQRSGGSGKDWRLFQVTKISGLVITPEVFERARPKYNPNDKAMVRIVCRL
ncbi:hypothetical protein JCM17845_15250 [Iodidimonas gelatinilytica]|uniref:WYL domain-containing protein n=1 Tax=Iodidimonas gelatinilytica TaxID=1236966 RepID=A0A5A7MY35_9PROT|nr:WYL domain-containing protein [Iodidimonas gelatinilytica]GER00902.1 hypothetical protein JCM17845_15250 [Iodidimonas gelatinilytica]